MAVSQMLSVTQLSQNIANNTSVVRITLTSTQTGESYNNNTLTGHYYIKKNGGSEVDYTFTTKLPKNSTVTCFTRDIEVQHNNDGTGSIAVRTSLDTHISAGTITRSKTLTLTTIPRATTPTLSASTADMGTTITINTPRASTSFAHQLTYSFGGVSGDIDTNVGDSTTWTIPLELANQIPNATSGVGTITCVTYSASGIIGQKTINFTATVPESVVPGIYLVNITDPSGNKDTYGDFVQNLSTVFIEVGAISYYGATISTTVGTIDGQAITSFPYTSEYLTRAGTKQIEIRATDSRGRTVTWTGSINVIEYSYPTISRFFVERCTADGTPDQEGYYGRVNIIGAITPLSNKNQKEFKVEYKESTASTWTTIQRYSVYELNATNIVACHVDNIYNFRVTATDSFGASAQTADLGTAYTLIDFRNTGKGIAFGKVSTQDGFECAMPMKAKSISAESISENGISIGDLHDQLESTSQEVAGKVDSTSFSVWTKVNGLYLFTDSDNGFIMSDKGNYSFTVTSWSDSRLKTNIQASEVDAISKINAIEMKSYDFIDERFGNHHDIGYIAHQLKEVVPEAVIDVSQNKEKMGYDSLLQVADTALIPYLVKAIQELTREIESLKNKDIQK